MLEKFFGQKPKGPEEVERIVTKIVSKEFSSFGVNEPAIHNAFKAARAENEQKGFGLTNNHLLNIIKECAHGQSSAIEDTMYGGAEQTFANINAAIENIRKSLSEEEQVN